jgi:succinate dehydrogenase hydrophobic anchor subunit
LKNFFIVSAIFMYLLYLLYFSELVIGEQFHHFILKSNIFNNLYDLFNIKFDFVKYYNIISIILMFILFAIILHGTIGLYMFFFDYLKESSFGLWTLLIYIIIIFLFVYMFFNENIYINFLTILPIKI